MADLTGPLGALTEALDALCAEDPQRLCDREAIKALHRQLARLEAATTRATAAFDAGRDWEDDKARSSASWIAMACHLPTSAARRRVRLGRELRLMDVVEKAWLAGDIGEAQVSLLARARTPRRAEAFTSHEELLVGYARSLRFGQFARALAY